MIRAITNYGPLKAGNEYRLLREGYDWYQVLCLGKPIFIPKWVVHG